MKFIRRTTCVAVCSVLFLTSCSSINQERSNNANYEYRREITQSKSEMVSTIAVVDDSVIYQTIESGKTTYYTLDVPTNRTIELGTISNFVMDAGAAALFNDAIYFYVTVGADNGNLCNILYSLDLTKSEIVKISEDSVSAPLISIYSVPQGVLALKIQNLNTYFEPDPGETFVIADVSEDYLFVFTYKESLEQAGTYDYYLKRYSLADYTEDGVIKLESIKSYIEESRIGKMELIGNFVFFENYSNIGLVCKITNNNVIRILEEENLTLARSLEGNVTTCEVFYIRRSNEVLLLDLDSGEMRSFALFLPNDENIQTILSNLEKVIVKAKKYTDSKKNDIAESVYLYEYSDFIDMTSVATE